MAELELVHVQLDELWANVKDGNQEMWLWLASDVKTKLIAVMHVGGRKKIIGIQIDYWAGFLLDIGRFKRKNMPDGTFSRYPPSIKGGPTH